MKRPTTVRRIRPGHGRGGQRLSRRPRQRLRARRARERARLRLGEDVIHYVVTRSGRRRRTVEIVVDPDDGVRVAAPEWTPDAHIEEFVRRRASWILKCLRDHEEHRKVHARRFVTGEQLTYLGRRARLRVLRAPANGRAHVRLYRGWLEVTLPKRARREDRKARVRRALEIWYRRHAERRLLERVVHYARRVGVRPAEVLIRSQEQRWGSCSSNGVLRLNWRLVMAPQPIIDYVVVHELCHLRYSNHGRRFWGAVESVLPDYERRREMLRKNGAHYHL